MTSKTLTRGSVDKTRPGHGARVLLVNKGARELAGYGASLQSAGYRVRSASSFSEGAKCLEREPFDLVLLDQGSKGFEGREVLMSAMVINSEVPVLVLARAYDRICYEEAMQAGALDYVEGPLSEAEIVAFVETFTPRRPGSRRSSSTQARGSTPGRNAKAKSEFKRVHLAKCLARDYGEALQL